MYLNHISAPKARFQRSKKRTALNRNIMISVKLVEHILRFGNKGPLLEHKQHKKPLVYPELSTDRKLELVRIVGLLHEILLQESTGKLQYSCIFLHQHKKPLAHPG